MADETIRVTLPAKAADALLRLYHGEVDNTDLYGAAEVAAEAIGIELHALGERVEFEVVG